MSGFGPGVPALWEALAKGRSCLEGGTPGAVGNDRVFELAFTAAQEALGQMTEDAEMREMPLVLGTNVGRVVRLAEAATLNLPQLLSHEFCPSWADHHGLAQDLARRLGLRPDAVALTGACASGALALGHAFDLIATGAYRRVIAGGADEVTPFKLAGHKMLGSAGRDGKVRPFDLRRGGTVFGEGAGFLILESLEECLARGRQPQAILAGYGVGSDTASLTAPDPGGAGAMLAMKMALADGGLGVDQIDHVQAHGTGTQLNDAIEARAIREVFRPHLSRMTVSADKGAIGHTFGASGVLSAILVILMMREGTILPAVGCEQLDPECELPLVMGQPVAGRIRAALCNNFGFGGSNVSLLFKAFEEDL